MAKKKKAAQSCDYKGCKIDVEVEGVVEGLKIDGTAVEIERDVDTSAYASPEAPYRVYGSLEELGKGIVDVRAEAGVEDGNG